MKVLSRWAVVGATAAMVLHGGAHSALAFGHGFRGGRMGMMAPMAGPDMLPLPVLLSVMTADQRQQLRSIMQADRPAMQQLMQQLRQAHEDLATRVFTPGTLAASDLDPQLTKIAGLRDQLVQHALATTLRVRALLTADQLAAAAQKKRRLGELRDEERSLMGGDTTVDTPAL